MAERLALLHDQYDNVMIETEILRFDEEIVLAKLLKIEEKQFMRHGDHRSSQVNRQHWKMQKHLQLEEQAFAGFGVRSGIASADESLRQRIGQ